MVYIGSGDGHLYALDETSGGQKWAMLIEVSQAGQPAAPLVNHGMIYLQFFPPFPAVGRRVHSIVVPQLREPQEMPEA